MNTVTDSLVRMPWPVPCCYLELQLVEMGRRGRDEK